MPSVQQPGPLYLGELQQVVPVRPLDRRAHDEEVVLVPLHAPARSTSEYSRTPQYSTVPTHSALLMARIHPAAAAAAAAARRADELEERGRRGTLEYTGALIGRRSRTYVCQCSNENGL